MHCPSFYDLRLLVASLVSSTVTVMKRYSLMCCFYLTNKWKTNVLPLRYYLTFICTSIFMFIKSNRANELFIKLNNRGEYKCHYIYLICNVHYVSIFVIFLFFSYFSQMTTNLFSFSQSESGPFLIHDLSSGLLQE